MRVLTHAKDFDSTNFWFSKIFFIYCAKVSITTNISHIGLTWLNPFIFKVGNEDWHVEGSIPLPVCISSDRSNTSCIL